jgi:hypothetical protein
MKTQEIKRGNYVEFYSINELKKNDVNRDIFTKHSESFKNKLIDFGWLLPITVSNNGDIIEGHHRVQAAIKLNQKTIPAYVIDWIDTNNKSNHLNCIINLNNGNRPWMILDYLKAFSKENKDYETVYNAYLKYNNSLSIGNIVNCYFGKSINHTFKKGKCKISDEKFANFLIENFVNLSNKHSKRKIQAYSVREMIHIAYSKSRKNIKLMKYLFDIYDDMATQNHSSLNSMTDFKLYMEKKINTYKKL